MNIQRSWVTPFTAGAFLLSGVTGILIFFHIDTGVNKFVHEWLGWLLLAGAALHVVVNYAGLKSHLATLRGTVLLGIFGVALIASFIPIGGGLDEPPFMQPIRALSQAPLATLAQVTQVTPEQMLDRVMKEGLQPISDQQSLSDLVGPDPRKQMHVLGKIMVAAE